MSLFWGVFITNLNYPSIPSQSVKASFKNHKLPAVFLSSIQTFHSFLTFSLVIMKQQTDKISIPRLKHGYFPYPTNALVLLCSLKISTHWPLSCRCVSFWWKNLCQNQYTGQNWTREGHLQLVMIRFEFQ